ncbi:tRNA (N6-adenosine(37)-N6)-threonylcarbamoyltransferase complex ATPase TsaE [Pasteurellaceae bacterium RH1A]|nr:tRNA (N6-adenosine(37)-N6)-threonylcarbamoyltransferase complex ATPase TsaE [Pasteurellaceae bacterium RH1A]
MTQLAFSFSNEEQMLAFGSQLAQQFAQYLAQNTENSLVIYLNGELGAGKTTLSRSIVRQFGYQGNVKSPTYTLVEEYQLPALAIYHFDLYRLADPEELEFMGIRDYFRPQTLCLLEWASRGQGMIPEADLLVQINYQAQGRELVLQAQSAAGQAILANFKDL